MPAIHMTIRLRRTPDSILVKRPSLYYIGLMHNIHASQEKTININTLVHRSTGALMAVSEDLEGFSLAGKSHDEILRKLEGALRDYFDLLGFDLISINVSSKDDGEITGFNPRLPAFIARASLGEKHAA